LTRTQFYRLGFVVTILLASVMAIALVIYALNNNINLYFTPHEIINSNLEFKLNQKIRLGGLVKAASVVRHEGLELEFVITDNQQEMLVKYTGVLPDLFKEGQGIVALGSLQMADNACNNQSHYVFKAEQVLAKHDENYTPPMM
jgi:cytochrome c-type biogenesis protein CcmE